MRHTLASLVPALFLIPSIAMGETVMYEDLVKLEGLHYYKFTGEPFTGKITGKKQGSFKDGKRDGPWVEYHDNGQLNIRGIYKDGKRYGSWVGYYDSGQLKFKVSIKDGKRHGSSVGYHKNGLLASKGTYKNGEYDGPWVSYHENGTVDDRNTGTFKDGVKVK